MAEEVVYASLTKMTLFAKELSASSLSDASTTTPPDLGIGMNLHGFTSKVKSLHELAPYIGKMRPELAAWAIERVSSPGDRILDPFCGSGTVLLEGWSRQRQVVGVDLSPYAWLISSAKLHGSMHKGENYLWETISRYQSQVERQISSITLDDIDPWIKGFYHPQTLIELLGWASVLREHRDTFVLSALMAISHHQRPGFLSFPSSHTVPYLRTKKFPPADYPELYEYREVLPRLEKKLKRAMKDIASLDSSLSRQVIFGDASKLGDEVGVFDAVITSPPYMGQLHYARDNRLRLALLGVDNWREIDKTISPNSIQFTALIADCFSSWAPLLKPGGRVAILIGDRTNTVKRRLDTFLVDSAEKSFHDFALEDVVESSIPNDRRARKNCSGSSAESLLIFKKMS